MENITPPLRFKDIPINPGVYLMKNEKGTIISIYSNAKKPA